MSVDYPGYAFAAAVAAGGLLGYYRKKSVPSLGAGLICGSILAFGAWQSSQDPPNFMIQIIATSSLAVFMGARFYKSKKLMPSGVVSFLSVSMLFHIASKASTYISQKHN